MFNITFLPGKLRSAPGEPPGHQDTTTHVTHVTVVAPRVDGSLHLPRGVAADPAVRRHGQRHAARGVGHVALDGGHFRYPPVNTQKAIENGHRNSGFIH